MYQYYEGWEQKRQRLRREARVHAEALRELIGENGFEEVRELSRSVQAASTDAAWGGQKGEAGKTEGEVLTCRAFVSQVLTVLKVKAEPELMSANLRSDTPTHPPTLTLYPGQLCG